MRNGLALAIEADCIPQSPLEPVTALLYGGICEDALDIARSADRRAALHDTLAQLRLLLAGVARRTAPGCAHRPR